MQTFSKKLDHDTDRITTKFTVPDSWGKSSSDRPFDQQTANDRTVITWNRKDFFKLHRLDQEHGGIIACTDDRDRERLANNIHAVLPHGTNDLKPSG